MATGGVAPGQFFHQLCIDQCHFGLDFGSRRDRDWMCQHHKGQLWIIQGLLLRHGHRQKRLSNDAYRWNTNFLEIDRILETPGGTAASFSNPGDDGVSLSHEGFEHLFSRGASKKRLLSVDNGLDALALL